MNVVITGANRGIGLGFVRHYLEQGDEVWACCRSDSGALSGIVSEKLHVVRWDVGSDELPQGELPEAIDLLINNAGIYGPGKDGQSLNKVTGRTMLDVFNIDCVGPLRVVQRLAGQVIVAKGIIANISSKMGSSDDNSSGGVYAYRAAKAGLVIVSKSMAVDLAPSGVHVITLHPGWVATDMVGNVGLIDVETSVAGMSRVIAGARNFSPGQFVAFDGKVVPY
ncbi:NAD(P)-dependent dehydrogenase, short-chain alcohol dehydrogenase family [Mariprofundus aestuarium]|uniref:NAD(P)-dependent dehydrogenase, short-chain alcohol dehydrogenase family n=1 Tax=Mariprofundus aestuarium TaxID=1921086 RepID=A0A2K8L0C7_MARES|nr:SDR family oxidoreductase [Mariprofundus aestuarium]ATX80755.1 NAD(P)-dependent dehydrogenase, short-chain alcohol dehydrogenase family [Mariprofundus aestuarium]